jgi:hypothetical protein
VEGIDEFGVLIVQGNLVSRWLQENMDWPEIVEILSSAISMVIGRAGLA